jgi:hypothetical protein
MRERAPAVCGECGRAGAFVAVVPELEADSEASSPRAAWLRAGVESGTFRSYDDVVWADDAA